MKNEKSLTLRLPAEAYNDLTMAAGNYMTVQGLIRKIIDDYFAQQSTIILPSDSTAVSFEGYDFSKERPEAR